jgi:hypothetical protein
MAQLSFPASPTNGQQYTDSNGKVWEYDGVKWNIATSESAKQFYGAKVSLSQETALTSVLSPIEFDVENFDTAAFYVTSNPATITIPRTGYYRINMLVLTGTEGFGASYNIELRRNSTNLFDDTMSANQAGTYNEVLLLDVGDQIRLYASESDGIGSLLMDSFIQIELVGYTFGGSLVPGFEFSGVKVTLQNDVTTTTTPTAITWTASDIEYNINANAAGNLYWSNSNATRFTIATTAYYNLKGFFLTGVNGTENSYTITIKKNGSTDLETILLGANASAALNETYLFNSTDYLEIYVSNSAGGATLIESIETFFELIRLGV